MIVQYFQQSRFLMMDIRLFDLEVEIEIWLTDQALSVTRYNNRLASRYLPT